MSGLSLFLLAAWVAAVMALLVRSGVGASLRAAVRTTIVSVLAWILAYVGNRPVYWPALSWRVWLMLALSVAAVVLAWALHMMESKLAAPAPMASADSINVYIAAAIAVLLILGPSPQRYVFAVLMVSGTIILALRRA
jgi:uncharacterized membrane protein